MKIIVRTDNATSFAVADTKQGKNHRRLYGAGPHVIDADVWTQPGGPRGTSAEQPLPRGTVIVRESAGDVYTCARWVAVPPT